MLSDHDQASEQCWYSASELSGLPGMPAASHNVTRKAKLEGWQSRSRQGRGGGNEYAKRSLPAITQTALGESNAQREVAHASLHQTTAVQPIVTAQSPRLELKPKLKTTINGRTDAWLEILRLYETAMNHTHFKTHLERDVAFVDTYNQQQLEYLTGSMQFCPNSPAVHSKLSINYVVPPIKSQPSAASMGIDPEQAKLIQTLTFKQQLKPVLPQAENIGTQAKSMKSCSLSLG